MYRARAGSVLALVWVLIFALSCDSRPKTETQRYMRQGLDSDLLEITPLADGGAYASGIDGAVWYIRAGRGMRVKGLPEKKGIVADITPTADGGAYMTGSGLWHLREGVAIKVEETPAVSGADSTLTSREKWLWALLQADRTRRRQAENAATDD